MAKKGDLYNIEEIEFKNMKQKAVAVIIAGILQESGLSQREFAEKIQVSQATFTNALRPYYGKVPTKNLIRSIASQARNPEEAYNEMMEAAGYEITKYPFSFSAVPPETIDTAEEEAKLRTDFMEALSQKNIFGNINTKAANHNGIKHDIVISFRDSKLPIDKWFIDVYTKFTLPREVARKYLYKILRCGRPAEKAKYSIITNSTEVFNELCSIQIPALNLLVSAIYYDGADFKETYLSTSINPDNLDNVGLSL